MRLALLLAALWCGLAFAQPLPHPVIFYPIRYSDNVTPVLEQDLHFIAWLQHNPSATTNENTIGNAVWSDANGGGIQVECSAFPGWWQVGQVLWVIIIGDGSNYTQAESDTFSIVLTSDPVQWATGNGPNGEFILPVELTSFSAEPQPGRVVLRWETASETDNAGFNILRAIDRSGPFTKINAQLIPGAGTSSQRHTYSYVDEDISGGLYFYQLEIVDVSGGSEFSDIIEVRPVPAAFALSSGHPNPMTQGTEISFQVPREGVVSVRIYDMAGRQVRTLQEGSLRPGFYTATWNGTDESGRPVGNGVYFVRMDAQGFNTTKKLVVLR